MREIETDRQTQTDRETKILVGGGVTWKAQAMSNRGCSNCRNAGACLAFMQMKIL